MAPAVGGSSPLYLLVHVVEKAEFIRPCGT